MREVHEAGSQAVQVHACCGDSAHPSPSMSAAWSCWPASCSWASGAWLQAAMHGRGK
jgi:hypothetical protein